MTTFPSTLLPPVVLHYAGELAALFGCPVAVPASLCLAMAGAALGNACQVAGPMGGNAVGANLYLALALERDGLLKGMLERISHRLVAHQTRAFQEHASRTPGALAEAAARIEREQAAFVKQDPYPDPAHLAYFTDQLQTLKRQTRPVIYLEDPSPAQLLPALHQSIDSALLAVCFNAATTEHLLASVQADKADVGDLLRKAWRQQTVTGAFLRGETACALVKPSLSLICLAQPAGLARGFSRPQLAAAGVAQQFLLLDCSLQPPARLGVMAAGQALLHQADWNRALKTFLTARQHQPGIWGYTLGSPANQILSDYQEELLGNLEGGSPEPDLAAHLVQCYKLALIDHLLRASHLAQVGATSAEAAVALARWFASQKKHLLARFEPQQSHDTQAAACRVMLAKIQAKGSVRRWDLFRCYNDQRSRVHQPILDQLIVEGLVVRGPEDHVMVAEKEATLFKGAAGKVNTEPLNALNH